MHDPRVTRTNFDPSQVQTFLRTLMGVGPSPCSEMRLFHATWDRHLVVPAQQYSKTLGGWYDSPEAVVADVGNVRYVSAYVTVNPVKKDLWARGANKLIKLPKGGGTTDDDIASLSWLYLDIDSKRPTDVSATDDELKVAIERRNQILAEVDGLRECSMWGSSGNGGFIFARLPDYPNDEHHRSTIANTLMLLAGKFNDARAFVDVKTKNPARVACLPGTLKCKGSDVIDRPYRLVTVDGVGWKYEPEDRFDLDRWLAGQGKTFVVIPAAPPAAQSRGRRDDFTVKRAADYVAKMDPAVSGQGGHDQTFDVACSLVLGFALSNEEARPILREFNDRCQPPWSDSELDHKLEDAEKKGGERGYLLGGSGNDWKAERAVAWFARSDEPFAVPGQDKTPSSPPCDEVQEGYEDNPHRLARIFWLGNFQHSDGPTLRYWNGDWYGWNGGAYRVISKDEIRSELARFVDWELTRLYNLALMNWSSSDKKKPQPWRVTTRLISDVMQALSGMALLKASTCPQQPSWIGKFDMDWPVNEMLPARNALVHLPSFARGDDVFWCHPSPRLFSAYCLSYEFDPEAARPVNWLTFLGALPLSPSVPIKHQIWPDDREAIDTLQEWMGLQLVPDTSYQKIGCLIGPPRSGKGTIARVMRGMVGAENCSGPTLSSFGTNFGLSPLVGKLAAIIDDARLGSKTDQAQVTERLLTISGEGSLTIDRKHREPVDFKLTARITFISNELPRLADSSTALANRLLLMRCTRSFLGQEDPALEAKLLPELPGILLWAIEGLKRLRDRGRFAQPESGETMLEEMEELASPAGAFVRDCLEEDPESEADVQAVYQAWIAWCEMMGERHPGNQANFGRNLRAFLPTLETKQRRGSGGERHRVFLGVRLARVPSKGYAPLPPSLEPVIHIPDPQQQAIPF